MPSSRFQNRSDAGRQLALKLLRFTGEPCVVYGLARGGVVVAFEVAKRLDAVLDVLVVRKIGHPGSPEYAYAAITAAGDLAVGGVRDGEPADDWLEGESKRELLEAIRRESVYTEGRVRATVEGKVAILVDDGIATGLTLEAALINLRRLKPSRIVIAAPVATTPAVERFSRLADEVVTVQTPPYLHAIGQVFVDFTQVSDADVLRCLDARAGE